MTYVLLLIVFLVAMKFLIPHLNKLMGAAYKAAGVDYEAIRKANEDNWRQIAQYLGLNFTAVAKPDDKKVWQGGGFVLSGTYQDKPVEMRFLSETREWAQGLQTGYEYYIDHKITVSQAGAGDWQVLPRSLLPAQTGLTGVAEFDQNLSLIAAKGSLPQDLLRALAQYGWMNLTLKDHVLVFKDDYAEYVKSKKGGMAMLSMVHPVWGSSVSNPRVDPERAKVFLDLLIRIAG